MKKCYFRHIDEEQTQEPKAKADMSGEGSRYKGLFEVLNICHFQMFCNVRHVFKILIDVSGIKEETRTTKVIFQQLEMQGGGGMVNDLRSNFYVNFRYIASVKSMKYESFTM